VTGVPAWDTAAAAPRRAGRITELRRQVPYVLVPAIPKTKDVPAQRAVTYVADFVYRDRERRLVVEDVKGVRAPARACRLTAGACTLPACAKWRIGIGATSAAPMRAPGWTAFCAFH
jgi:hypothetical protein